jgi:hypothetical protein
MFELLFQSNVVISDEIESARNPAVAFRSKDQLIASALDLGLHGEGSLIHAVAFGVG